MISLQDINIYSRSSAWKRLTRSYLQKLHCQHDFEWATYSLSGVGGQSTIFKVRYISRIYTVPLITSKGDTLTMKAFSVVSVLSEKIGKGYRKIITKNILKSSCRKPKLGLAVSRRNGFWCGYCDQGRCLYKSKFANVFVPLGSFGQNSSIINSVTHVTISLLTPPLSGPFFQGKVLGVSPIERCVTYAVVKQ